LHYGVDDQPEFFGLSLVLDQFFNWSYLRSKIEFLFQMKNNTKIVCKLSLRPKF